MDPPISDQIPDGSFGGARPEGAPELAEYRALETVRTAVRHADELLDILDVIPARDTREARQTMLEQRVAVLERALDEIREAL